mgnify:CR=1 FL=1
MTGGVPIIGVNDARGRDETVVQILFTLPVRIKSLNAILAYGLRERMHEKRAQRTAALLVTRSHVLASLGGLRWPLLVDLVRVGPRRLDDDNLAGALKHIRDGVAAALGVDDGDTARVTWRYGQRQDRQAVGVEVTIRAPPATGAPSPTAGSPATPARGTVGAPTCPPPTDAPSPR